MIFKDKETFKKAYENKYRILHGEELEDGNNQQKYEALGSLIRDCVVKIWMETNRDIAKQMKNKYIIFQWSFY